MKTLFWQMLGATLRPFVPWHKAAWFYADTGNNGKGSYCHLARNLVGRKSCTSINLKQFSEQFALGSLIGAQAIIVDENPVRIYIDKSDALKAVITNDVVQIERKFKNHIPYRFYGFMIQCLNEKPRTRDKSQSFYRRQLFVPFTKSFTGKERKYIKADYLSRKEVLEYCLYKVLNMDYYELIEPSVAKQALKDYQEFNDPVRQFVQEVLPELKWLFLPNDFLYDLYKGWIKKISPASQVQNKNSFLDALRPLVPEDWEDRTERTSSPVKIKNKMIVREPLVAKYNLIDWMNPRLVKDDNLDKTIPDTSLLPVSMRGLLRKK